MVKTEFLDNVEKIVAYNKLTSTIGALYKRLDRKYRTLGKEVYEGLIRGNKLPKDSSVEAKLHWEDKKSARSYSLALQEFKQVDPKGYETFIGIKKKHIGARRNYILFGILDGENLTENIYLEIMKDVGLNENEAIKLYDSLVKFGEDIEKKKKNNLEKLLVKI